MRDKAKVAEILAALAAHWQARRGIPPARLFDEDDKRFENFSAVMTDAADEDDDGVLFDYSKTAVTAETMDLLEQLAEAAGVRELRDAMFAGERINRSENRAVLHTVLRAAANDHLLATVSAGRGVLAADGGVGGVDMEKVVAEVIEKREEMLAYAEAVRAGGEFTDVVNLGIGGSDLGPAMAVAALAPDCAGGLRAHFVSNVDGAHLADVLAGLDARRTLVVVSSKTFTTMETLANARRARAWLAAAVGEAKVAKHMVAVTAAPEKARAFGIGRVFEYWVWVGGRYSLWGAVGLPLALALGAEGFRAFLRGGLAADYHFRRAALRDNVAMLWGLVGVWHRTVCGYPTRAIVPYDQRLALLPAYLQQLDMESNGKGVAADGGMLAAAAGVAAVTAPVVWGSVGTNAQHAYFQMLHQGTDIVPCDFIAAKRPRARGDEEQHRLLLANCFAQSAALLVGDGGDSDDSGDQVSARARDGQQHEQTCPAASSSADGGGGVGRDDGDQVGARARDAEQSADHRRGGQTPHYAGGRARDGQQHEQTCPAASSSADGGGGVGRDDGDQVGARARDAEQSADHRRGGQTPHYAGGRPSVTVLYGELTPYSLGRLIALCEHRVFVEGAVWGINSFDQWGVELGKAMARQLLAPLSDPSLPAPTAQTRGILSHYHRHTTKH